MSRWYGAAVRRLGTWTAALVGAAAVALTQPQLAASYHRFRVTEDFYALPPTQWMVLGSLGYRAALADVLYGNLLVANGIHFAEKRRFDSAAAYLDAILALDPNFREAYYFGDTILVFQPGGAKYEDLLLARQLLERGLQTFPHDQELWVSTGQFIAFMGPAMGFMQTPERAKLRDSWRLDGARILARACELPAASANLSFHCLSATRLLREAGEHETQIRFLERVLQLSDDPDIRARAETSLAILKQDQYKSRSKLRYEAMRLEQRTDLYWMKLDRFLLLGPRQSRLACAAGGECVTDWRTWSANHAPVSP